MRKIMPLLGGWVILSLVAAALLLLWSWPWRPHSALGWGLLFLGALPLTFLGEYLGERIILQSPIAARLDALGSGPQASALRITYVLICLIVVGAVGGAVAALATAFFSPLRGLLDFAWRMWLWGSVGFIIGNVVLLAILFPFLSNVGIVGGAPRHPDVLGSVLLGLTLLGPLLFSSVGVILGCLYGWRLARRRMSQPGV